MRIADNRVDSLLGLYDSSLAARYAAGERRAIVRAVFQERLGWDAAQLEMHRNEALSESELLQVYDPLKRLQAGEPLQYVLGHVHFHGLRLAVAPGVLIPRPETEELVYRLVEEGGDPQCIVDLGTGSGCIALALQRAFPRAKVTGVDVSPDALAIARSNGALHGLAVKWVLADLRDPDLLLPDGTDLVVSNPPYVPLSEAPSLSEHVREHEPGLALFVPDDDPLLFYRRIAAAAIRSLVDGGRIAFEGHYRHAAQVGDLLRQHGFRNVRVEADLSGLPRFILAQR